MCLVRYRRLLRSLQDPTKVQEPSQVQEPIQVHKPTEVQESAQGEKPSQVQEPIPGTGAFSATEDYEEDTYIGKRYCYSIKVEYSVWYRVWHGIQSRMQ
jgi:hypothetical protein